MTGFSISVGNVEKDLRKLIDVINVEMIIFFRVFFLWKNEIKIKPLYYIFIIFVLHYYYVFFWNWNWNGWAGIVLIFAMEDTQFGVKNKSQRFSFSVEYLLEWKDVEFLWNV